MQEKQLAPGARATAVVEWQRLATSVTPGTHFTLELWDAEG